MCCGGGCVVGGLFVGWLPVGAAIDVRGLLVAGVVVVIAVIIVFNVAVGELDNCIVCLIGCRWHVAVAMVSGVFCVV